MFCICFDGRYDLIGDSFVYVEVGWSWVCYVLIFFCCFLRMWRRRFGGLVGWLVEGEMGNMGVKWMEWVICWLGGVLGYICGFVLENGERVGILG